MVFELRQDVDCMNAAKSEACFSVVIQVNGIDLGLPGCQKGHEHTTGCSYVDFVAYLSEVWYSGDDLDQACLQAVENL